MKLLGVVFESNKANISLVEVVDQQVILVKCKETRILYNNELGQAGVKEFFKILQKLVAEHDVQKIGIKKRQLTGKFSGDALSFKMEALIQMLDLPVEILAPQTISKKSKGYLLPKELFKYQEDAYKTAISLV